MGGALPVVAVVAAVISTQAGAAFAKGLFHLTGPVGMTSLRLSLAALILLAVFRPALSRLGSARWSAALMYGAALCAMNLTYYLAIARLPIGLVIAIAFLGPLCVAAVSSRRPQDLAWVGLAAAGITLLAPWRDLGALDLAGVGLALLSGAAWAAYVLAGRRMGQAFEGGQGVAVGMLVGAVLALPFALANGLFSTLTPGVLLAGLGVALLSSALPYSLEMLGLRALPARTFSILLSLEPAIGVLTGWLLLHEVLSPLQLVAVLCIMAASIGATVGSRNEARPKALPA
nr:EamA family transporter [Deinobacterium chartae]